MIGFHTDIKHIDKYIDKYPLQIFLGSPFSYIVSYSYKDFLLDKITNKIYIHSKYTGNICKPRPTKVFNNIKNELDFLDNNLNMKKSGTVVHLSKKYGEDHQSSLDIVVTNLNKILNEIKNTKNYIILETSNIVNHLGASIEDFEYIYRNVEKRNKLKFCVDTAHIFNTFYDISSLQGIVSYFEKFNRYIGISNIVLIHLNDSLGGLFLSEQKHIPITKGNIFNNPDQENLIFIKTIANIFNIDIILERRVIKTDEEYNEILKEINIFNQIPVNKYKPDNVLDILLNKKIIYYLNEYRKIYETIDNNKYYAYIKAAASLVNNPVKHKWENTKIIEENNEILKKYNNIDNIGDSISEKILHIIKNNYNDLEKLKKQSKYYIHDFYNKYKFLGSDIIKLLMEKKYMTVDDLLKDKFNILTKSDKNEIKLINKLQPVPINFVEQIKQELHKIIKLNNKKCEWYMLGSYIRKESFVNDIDILLVEYDINDFLNNVLKKKFNLIQILRSGDLMLSAIFLYNNIHFQIDLIYSNYEDKYTQILYFTGSKTFNIYMRYKAKELGYKLNQYGLYKNDKKIRITSEEEIFKLLKIKYIEPTKRI